VHLHDFDGDLYGATLRLHLVEPIRPERKFAGLPELVAQIRKDIETARQLTARSVADPSAGGAWY
jgi:riboflavin kinase/FMN adenylyltransferase